jgi:hypothetical protein
LKNQKSLERFLFEVLWFYRLAEINSRTANQVIGLNLLDRSVTNMREHHGLV